MTSQKTVIFLGSKDFGDKNNAGLLADKIRAMIGVDYSVRHYYFEDLLFHISADSRTIHTVDGYELKKADLIIAFNWYPAGKRSLRDIALTVGLYAQENGVQLWNSETLQQRSTTKLSAMWLLAAAGVAVPETFFSLNHDVLAAACAFAPAIVKDIATSRGRNNYLARTNDELVELLAQHAHNRFMVQAFIPNDYDVRLICLGGKPHLALKRQRTSTDTHLNNTSQGAEASLLLLESLPTDVLAEAEKVCTLMGREMAGIDYVIANDGSGRYICLEVNAIPQLTSGSYVDQKMQAFSDAILRAF